MRVLVVGDKGDDDPGFVGERLEAVGATLVPLDRDALCARNDVGPADLLFLLGSARAAYDSQHAGAVEAEARFIRAALGSRVPVLGICYGAQLLALALGGQRAALGSRLPVLGICYGAQLLALALGGQVMPAPVVEVGWFRVDSDDPVLCPPGPWLQFHQDAFTPPQGVRVLGSSPGGCQGFAYERDGGRALAWQFHPEVTPAELARWLDSAGSFVREQGGDPVTIQAEADVRAGTSRKAAYDLTDAALRWLGLGVGV